MAKIKPQLILRYSLILLIIVVVGSVCYRFYQIRQEKQNFAKAEVQIDALAQQIQDTVGPADEVKEEKSCSYANRKFEKGPLSCAISSYLLFKNVDLKKANDVLSQLSAVVDGEIYDSLGRDNKSFGAYTGIGPGEELGQAFRIDDVQGSINCSVTYIYPLVSLYNKTFLNVGDKDFQVDIVCGGQTKSELYPVKSD